ncbi:MAG: TolC family protein [Thermaurantimonas sp.]
MKIRNLLILNYLSCSICLLNAQDTLLNHLIEKMLVNHPQIQMARNTVAMADLMNNPGQAGMLPTLDILAGANQSTQNTDLEFFSGQKSSANNARSQGFNATARLEWMIFDGLRMFALKNELKIQEILAETELRISVENALLDLLTAYYSARIQQNILFHTKENFEISRTRLRLAESRYSIGRISSFQYLQAVQDFNQDSATYLREQLIFQQLMARLLRLTDISVQETELSATPVPTIELPPKYEWLELMKNQNTSLQSARLRHKALKYRDQGTIADFLPQVGLFGEYNLVRQQNEIGVLKSLAVDGTNAGLLFRWNLFNGLADRNRRKASMIETENAELQAKQLELELSEFFENTYNQLATNINIYNLERANQESVAEQTKISEIQYKQGRISDLEFRNSQTSLLNAKLRMEEAYLNSLLSYVQLMLITGQISGAIPK